MITYNQALQIALSAVKPLNRTEKISLDMAEGRFLATELVTDRDLPPFNRVAVDGYACKKADLGKELIVLEVVPAGKIPQKHIHQGECSKVMTGCPLPEGAELVFMVEDSFQDSEGKVRFTGSIEHSRIGNFSLRGEEVKSGTVIFPAGKQISVKDIGTMALTGAYQLKVHSRLKIGVIATGDELVEPWETPSAAQIRNANSYQLLAQIKKSGQEGHYYGIVQDDPECLSKIFTQAVEECDLVLLTGGVSAGDFDFVPQIMQNEGFKILFDRVAIKPGKPTTFAVSEEKIVVGLPGNPVSAFVIYELFVQRIIHKMMAGEYLPAVVNMVLATDYKRRNAEREEFVPVYFANGQVMPVNYHGSGHLQALTKTDGLMRVAAGVTCIAQGTTISIDII